MNEGVRCADTGETVFQAGGSARSNLGAFEEQQGGERWWESDGFRREW